MENKISKYIFTFLVIFCFILMIVSVIKPEYIGPVRKYANVILTPVEKAVNNVGNTVNGTIREAANKKRVYDENTELLKRIDLLTEENNALKSDAEELNRLRKLYELDSAYAEYEKVAARVIAKEAGKWFSVFRIDKGISDGIEVGMNVLSGGGLLGIVIEVNNNYSVVRSILDDESTVYAMSQISNETCLVRGNTRMYENGLLELSNIDKYARINDGDPIVTSNLSTKYLPGILIGYANGIEVNSMHLSKSGGIIPVADFENLQEVLIIKQVKIDTGVTVKDEN
ncbi:MAG: rod shape-determining protein MreC [Eubacteriales bacterium]|nr:rod shape-determining protein MreC [Eubacteriales bacterium]